MKIIPGFIARLLLIQCDTVGKSRTFSEKFMSDVKFIFLSTFSVDSNDAHNIFHLTISTLLNKSIHYWANLTKVERRWERCLQTSCFNDIVRGESSQIHIFSLCSLDDIVIIRSFVFSWISSLSFSLSLLLTTYKSP